MYCVRCRHDVIHCECPDIDRRLASLCDGETAVAPAARQNLIARLLAAQAAGRKPH